MSQGNFGNTSYNLHRSNFTQSTEQPANPTTSVLQLIHSLANQRGLRSTGSSYEFCQQQLANTGKALVKGQTCAPMQLDRPLSEDQLTSQVGGTAVNGSSQAMNLWLLQAAMACASTGIKNCGGKAGDKCVSLDQESKPSVTPPINIPTGGEVSIHFGSQDDSNDYPITAEAKLIPCPARGMPTSHNETSALLTIPAAVVHGEELICSDLKCRHAGIKFLYCIHCGIPVPKRNFKKKHDHTKKQGLGQPVKSQDSHMHVSGTVVTNSSLDGLQREKVVTSDDSLTSYQEDIIKTEIERKQAWESLLKERPTGQESSNAIELWLKKVVSVSDTYTLVTPDYIRTVASVWGASAQSDETEDTEGQTASSRKCDDSPSHSGRKRNQEDLQRKHDDIKRSVKQICFEDGCVSRKP